MLKTATYQLLLLRFLKYIRGHNHVSLTCKLRGHHIVGIDGHNVTSIFLSLIQMLELEVALRQIEFIQASNEVQHAQRSAQTTQPSGLALQLKMTRIINRVGLDIMGKKSETNLRNCVD